MKDQNGFTLTEILIAFVMLLVIVGLGGLVYAAIHFVAKFW